MTYTVTLSNGNVLTTIADSTLDNTSSLTLLGRNYAGYGTIIANDFVHLLENAANTTPPVPALTGQLWYNSTTQTMMLWNGVAWVIAGVPANETFASGITFQSSLDMFNANAPANDKRYRIGVDNAGEWQLQGINDDGSVRNTPIVVTTDGFIHAFATPSIGDNSLRLATTAYVQAYAPLNSPALTGSPTAPTPLTGDADTSIATTAFVTQAVTSLFIATRIRLTGILNLYVSPTGNDANNGLTISTPKLSFNAAWNLAAQNYDGGGYGLIINAANGTYSQGLYTQTPLVGFSTATLLGNRTTPASCLIQTTNGCGISFSNPGTFCMASGFRLVCGGGPVVEGTTGPETPDAGVGFTVRVCAYGGFSDLDFGPCGSNHMWAGRHGTISIAGNYKISGGAVTHYNCGNFGNCWGSNGDASLFPTNPFAAIVPASPPGIITCTLTGTPTFSQAFAQSGYFGNMQIAINFVGAATGPRYLVTAQSAIITTGSTGVSRGINYFPGTIAGTVQAGGSYI